MMQERGMFVDYSTVQRWVMKLVPVFATEPRFLMHGYYCHNRSREREVVVLDKPAEYYPLPIPPLVILSLH